MKIAKLDPNQPAAQHLIALSDAHMAALYPSESNHPESISGLQLPNVLFVGGYVGDELVACGAVKTLHDDGSYGEIKRMFVLDGHRGKGYSKRILQHLEAHLAQAAIKLARLETGIRQREALGLYRRLGYVERAPFGAYQPDPLSVFMEKQVA
ncbi:MAG TPA: GNAT family N-acetyltransferase [Burkholderiaceae bacterium]